MAQARSFSIWGSCPRLGSEGTCFTICCRSWRFSETRSANSALRRPLGSSAGLDENAGMEVLVPDVLESRRSSLRAVSRASSLWVFAASRFFARRCTFRSRSHGEGNRGVEGAEGAFGKVFPAQRFKDPTKRYHAELSVMV